MKKNVIVIKVVHYVENNIFLTYLVLAESVLMKRAFMKYKLKK